MTPLYVSSSYLANAMSQSVMQTQRAIAQAGVEASTGQYADLGLQLGETSGLELSLKSQISLIDSYTAANAVTTTSLTTAQSALTSIGSTASSTQSELATFITDQNSNGTLQTLGSGALQSLISNANVAASGQYVFGGINSSEPPLKNYYSATPSSAKSAVDAAFQSYFGFAPGDAAASTITASSMQGFLSGPFANLFSGANWTSNWSTASSTNVSSEVSTGLSVTTSTNTNEGGFSSLAQAYTMLAEFGGSAFSQSVQQVVASTASTLIATGLTSSTQSEATLGAAQAQVSDANESLSSGKTILTTQIGQFDNVDANTIAVTINSLMNQLQTSYDVTSRLHSMSLAQYLPTS